MSPNRPSPGERWTICALDHVHWGANGGAGLLMRYKPQAGEPVYLLARRSRWVDEGGSWGIPGGAIRDGESLETAARRETSEEIGALPSYRVSAIESQDCGGGWLFHIVIADVEEPFAAYCVHETDETGWFTAAATVNVQLHPGLRRWFDQQGR